MTCKMHTHDHQGASRKAQKTPRWVCTVSRAACDANLDVRSGVIFADNEHEMDG